METFFVVAAIGTALFFYWIRCQTRLWYGVIEIAVAVLIIFLTFYPQTNYLLIAQSSQWSWLSRAAGALAGIYVIVRGLDNIENGLGERARDRWRQLFYAPIRSWFSLSNRRP
jgi:hypothetical protein